MTEPTFQFRGVWFPAAMIRLLAKGKINPTDAVIYGMISMLNDKYMETSNERLANLLGITSRQVSRSVRKLKSIGAILTSYDTNGRRLIEVICV